MTNERGHGDRRWENTTRTRGCEEWKGRTQIDRGRVRITCPAPGALQIREPRMAVALVPKKFNDGEELCRHHGEHQVRKPNTKVDTRTEVRVNRQVLGPLALGLGLRVDGFEILPKLTIDVDCGPHVQPETRRK